MASSSPNLLSFSDSWEYEGSSVGGPSLIASSLSGEDSLYSSFSNSTNTNTNSSRNHRDVTLETVRVNVSGTIYTIEKKDFDKLQSLPWIPLSPPGASHDSPRAPAHYSLCTAPEFFEILLNHVVYRTLPDLRSLRTADLEELEPLVLLLGLHDLAKHLGMAVSARVLPRAPSFRRKRASKSNNLRNATSSSGILKALSSSGLAGNGSKDTASRKRFAWGRQNSQTTGRAMSHTEMVSNSCYVD